MQELRGSHVCSGLWERFFSFHFKRKWYTRRKSYFPYSTLSCLGDFKSGNSVRSYKKLYLTLKTENISKQRIQEEPEGHWCCSGPMEPTWIGAYPEVFVGELIIWLLISSSLICISKHSPLTASTSATLIFLRVL